LLCRKITFSNAMKQIPDSELILNKDGSIYHLDLRPEDISDTIINVGDPDRVAKVSRFFQKIEIRKQKREFVTHTGYYNGKRISVISTGIGTDNIDIVYNELDALVNVDLETRFVKPHHTALKLIRIGTSGALHTDIPVDSFVCASFGLGLDGLLNFYKPHNTPEETVILDKFKKHYPNEGVFAESYLTKASDSLFNALSPGMITGITASCAGFFGPQGRVIRLPLARPHKIEKLSTFRSGPHRVTNFEMETGAMYGLAKLLGHSCCSTNVIVANRITHQYSRASEVSLDSLIEMVLDRMTA
jgi:uridine phosphorylase